MNQKIFLVDDDPFCRTIYEQEILNLGFGQLTCFETGTELLSKLCQNPDLIFMDYNLEDYKGLELLTKIKSFDPSITVVVISGQSDMEITVQLLNNGAFDYIVKDDFDAAKITRVLGKWMAARKLKKNLKIKEGSNSSDNYLRVISAAQETVRKEISGELHDNVNQLLGASKLYMDIALKEDENRISMIRESKHILDSAITEVRKLSHCLQSGINDNFDLDSELNKMIRMLKKQNRFNVSSNIAINESNVKVSPAVQHEIFRIIQEQVNNIIKYSKAKKVQIELIIESGMLQLHVSDDGIGFNPDEAKSGIGLSNIFKRVSSINGQCQILAAVDKGCSWYISIPLNNKQYLKVYN